MLLKENRFNWLKNCISHCFYISDFRDLHIAGRLRILFKSVVIDSKNKKKAKLKKQAKYFGKSIRKAWHRLALSLAAKGLNN